MKPFAKGDKVIVTPWNQGHDPKPGVIEEIEKSGRQAYVSYGWGRFQWVAVKRLERPEE